MEKEIRALTATTYIAADNIISPLGFTSAANFEELRNMRTGVQYLPSSAYSREPFYAALIQEQLLDEEFHLLNTQTAYTKLEKLIILSISKALQQNPKINVRDKKTVIILSTTKGNIDLLGRSAVPSVEKKRVYLWEMARVIGACFQSPHQPLVVSNACISGVMGIILGKRLLETQAYENVIVCGVDILTEFVVSGFQSFKAVSNSIARPYDEARDGITLGEGCGTVILTNQKKNSAQDSVPIIIKGGAVSNDANHISGPSRTGDGLLLAIEKTLAEAAVLPQTVDYISGHGTATVYNDEMEALAVTDAQLATVPMNSLKSYFGHTLGAAGVIESIIGLHSMYHNTLIGTYQFRKLGVSKPIHIIQHTQAANIHTCLKTAAGFGGCNAAILFQKETA